MLRVFSGEDATPIREAVEVAAEESESLRAVPWRVDPGVRGVIARGEGQVESQFVSEGGSVRVLEPRNDAGRDPRQKDRDQIVERRAGCRAGRVVGVDCSVQ